MYGSIPDFFADILIFASLAVVYMLILRRADQVAQPFRIALADRGEQYLTKCDPADARTVKFMLDNAFNSWVAPMSAIFIPLYLVGSLGRELFGKQKMRGSVSSDRARVMLLFAIVMLARSPVAGLIVVIEILIFGSVVVLLSGPTTAMRGLLKALQAEAYGLGRAGA